LRPLVQQIETQGINATALDACGITDTEESESDSETTRQPPLQEVHVKEEIQQQAPERNRHLLSHLDDH